MSYQQLTAELLQAAVAAFVAALVQAAALSDRPVFIFVHIKHALSGTLRRYRLPLNTVARKALLVVSAV
jgi:hypothetical protein